MRYRFLTLALICASFSTHAQTSNYPDFVIDAQVPIPTADVLTNPRGLAVAPGGTLYIADSGNGRVLRISPSGTQTTVTFGTLHPALVSPVGVALDPAGNLYVTDIATNRVIKLPAGATNGIAIISGLNLPTSIAVDSSGNLAIVNAANNTITERRAGGQPFLFNTGTTHLLGPSALAFNNQGSLYVGDQNSFNGIASLYLFPKLGGTATIVNTFNTLTAGITGLAVDAQDNLYYSLALAGLFHPLLELPATGKPAFFIPVSANLGLSALALDNLGNLYVADDFSSTVSKLYYNNVAHFGFMPVGTTSAPISFNYAFYQDTDIDSSQGIGGGAIGSEYFPGPQSSPASPATCQVHTGHTYTPQTIDGMVIPATCTFNFRFQPSMVGGRPGAVQLKTSIGTASQLTIGTGLGAQLALLNAPVLTKFANYSIRGLIVNAASTEIYFTAAGGTYKAFIGSDNATLISPLSGQMAINGAGDLFLFNAPTIIKIPADGTANITIHVPGLFAPYAFAMDYNGAFYVTDYGPGGEGPGMVLRLGPTGAVSNLLTGQVVLPSFITADDSGNIYIVDDGSQAVISAQVGDGSQTVTNHGIEVGGFGGDEPDNLAVDQSGTPFYYTLEDFSEGMIYSAPNSYASSYGCDDAGGCYLPLYTVPGITTDEGYLPFYSAFGTQTMATSTSGNLYVVNGQGTGVFRINRSLGNILPQAFQSSFPSFGGATQLANVYNMGNQPLVFTDPVNAYTQTGNTTAFTLGTGSCVPGASILPGNYCTVPVTDVNASSNPPAATTLHFLTNAVNNTTATFTITGPAAP